MANVNTHNQIFPFRLRQVTEQAARASFSWIGRGQKEKGDEAAVEAMWQALKGLKLEGTVIIGEGEKDQASKLYKGEHFGEESDGETFDIAVDPVEGTTFLAKGLTNAMAAVAIAPRYTILDPGPAFYMEKFAGPPELRGRIDMEWTVEKKLNTAAALLEKEMNALTVFVLDKPRHRNLVESIYEVGVRVALYPAGDIAGALMAATPDTEIDLLMGTGGVPEGIISACAIRAMGGEFLGRLDPQLPTEIVRLCEAGMDTSHWYDRDELIRSDKVHFCATGITSGLLFEGIEKSRHFLTSQTLIINGSNQERLMLTNWHRIT